MSKKNKFLSLLQYEANRNFTIIMINVLVTVILTVLLYYERILRFIYMHRSNEYLDQVINGMAIQTLGINEGAMYIFFLEGLLVVIFSIFIWAREFSFEHKTSYRTLSLPIKRWKIILSKSLVVMLFYGMFWLGQFLSIIIKWFILRIKVRSVYDIGFNYLIEGLFKINNNGFVSIEFSTVIITIFMIFTASLVGGLAVLLKQSFGLKGVFYWILYGISAVLIFFYIPIFKMHFFSVEFLLLYTVGILIFIGITFVMNNYLINKKVSV
ncbi:hypothetical protein [Clostridium sp.]|uniref:hypothetical protein n=1 Tax=Clostridium sp. TaxID=1506 RepID=UPI00262F648C|nr:hypothetical protein [Clostridium sp.]